MDLNILLAPGLTLQEGSERPVRLSLTRQKNLILCGLLPNGSLQLTTLPVGGISSYHTRLDGPFIQFLWEDTDGCEDVLDRGPRLLTLHQDNKITVYETYSTDRHTELSTLYCCDEDTLKHLCADKHVCVSSTCTVRLLSLKGDHILLLLSSSILLHLCCTGKDQKLQVLSCFSLDLDPEATLRISDVCLRSGILFLLDSSGFVYVYDTLDGLHLSDLELPLRSEEGASDPLSSLRISPDLSLAVVSSASCWALPMCLGEGFRQNLGDPKPDWHDDHIRDAPGTDEDDISSSNLNLCLIGHSFRTDRSWDATLTSLYQRTRNDVDTILSQMSYFSLPRQRSRERLSASPVGQGWVRILQEFTDSPANMQTWSVSPFSAMFCTWGMNSGLTVIRWDLETQRITFHHLGKASCVDCMQEDAMLVITDQGLSLVLFSASQNEFLTRLMIHGSASTADTLCHLNNWGRCSVPIHALEAGLENRQLDTVNFFLKSKESILTPLISRDSSGSIQSESYLHHVQELLPALDLLLSYIRDTDQETQSKHFSEQLLQLTLHFVHEQLQKLCSLLSETDSSLRHSVGILTGYITELRPFMKKFVQQPQAVEIPTASPFEIVLRGNHRWKNMSVEHIISDAILENRIPEAQTFLRLQNHPTASLTWIKQQGLRLVYKSLLETRVQDACKLLQNMGFSVFSELHRICLHTCDRGIRTMLVDLLETKGYLSEHEQEEIGTVCRVEELYFANNKITEKKQKHRRPAWNVRRVSKEQAILQEALTDLGDESQTLLLHWAKGWDSKIQESIVLPQRDDQGHSSHPDILWRHLTLWHTWPKIRLWIENSGAKSENEDNKSTHWPPLTPTLVEEHTLCCDYTQQKILDLLASVGVFVPSEIKDFERHIERLAVSRGLMPLNHHRLQSCDSEDTEHHTQFVQLCADRYLHYLLYTYLDYHRLHPEICPILANTALHETKPWFGFLVQMRQIEANPEDYKQMFYASLSNSHMVMPGYQPSVSNMLLEGHTLLALATNMYAPGGIDKVLEQRDETAPCNRNVDPQLLKMALAPYPKLKAALFSQHPSSSGPIPSDISLYHLLQSLTPFHPTRFFTWQIANTLVSGDNRLELPHCSCPWLVNKISAREYLDVWFLLRSGRPAVAFATFVVQQLMKSKAPQLLIQQTADEVYSLALSCFHVSSVVASCVIFLELLGLSSHKLRIDVNIANLILNHKEFMQEDVIHGCQTQSLAQKLSRLVDNEAEAARDLLLTLEEATLEREKENGSSLFTSLWIPVLQFCLLHSIPLSTTYLRNCAQNQDWLQLLVYTHTQEQVASVLEDLEPALRSHMALALQNVPPDSQLDGIITSSDLDPYSLHHVLLQCQKMEQPELALLKVCVRYRVPLLSVLAACLQQDTDCVSCLCAWIVTSVDPVTYAEITHSLSASSEHQWDLKDLTCIWGMLLEKEDSRTLHKAFSIFIEDCPLLLLLDVYLLCLQQKNYEMAKQKMQDFLSTFLSLKSEEASFSSFPSVSWIQDRASQLLRFLLVQSKTLYELRKVLQLFCETESQHISGDTDVHKLSVLTQLLQDHPICISKDLLCEYSPSALHSECQRLVQILQNGGHFSLARKVAELGELQTDNLVVEEVLQDQRLLQEIGQWQSIQSRAQYWRKCHQMFNNNDLSSEVASDFFLSQASGSSSSGTLDGEEAEDMAEKELLLTLAGHWLSLSDSVQLKSLEELEQQIWKCRILQRVRSRTGGRICHPCFSHLSVTIPSFTNLASQFSFSSLPVLNPPALLDVSSLPPLHGTSGMLDTEESSALSSLIDQLLDESRVHEASRVCRYFQLPHHDLWLVLNCRSLATGETAQDQLHPDIQAILKGNREMQENILNRRKRLHSSSSLESRSSQLPTDRVLTDLEILKNECTHGKTFCRQLLCVYELSQDLGCSFSEVSSRDAGDILRSLLSCHRHELSDRAQAVISSHSIPPHTVAQIVSEEGLKSWMTLGEDKGLAEMNNISEMRNNFLQLAKLCPDPTLVGLTLLDHLESVPLTNLQCIIELLISAHDCFSLTCHMEGIRRVLQACRHLTEMHLAPNQEYRLMVRLLSGIGRYNDMVYVFDILHKNQHFEALLRKQLDTKGGLQTALLEYIKRCHPGDSEKHNMTALCFSLHRDIGHNHEHAALIQLRLIQSQPWEYWLSEMAELRSAIMKALTLLIDAAESYSKDSCVRQSLRCARLTRLLTLQLHLLNSGHQTRLINLDRESLVEPLVALPRFYQAVIVTEAYDLLPDWAEILYKKVIIGGDFHYLEEFKQRRLLQGGIFEQISQRCKLQPPGTTGLQNLKRLIGYCENTYMRYKLALENQFYDITDVLMRDSQTRCCLTDMLSR
ncbi:spatacsin isoform X2 [Bombina bombina]|nr:spatacsin isoform X2 [Bombina bombina]XP_053574448.1 spatacsin isoform X2 [Bombina bombina]